MEYVQSNTVSCTVVGMVILEYGVESPVQCVLCVTYVRTTHFPVVASTI